MAYTVPLDQPLSESQAKLISQMGTMKNLADIPFLKKFKIKKEDGVSMFDYMIKVLRSMGIDPQLILTAFLNELFRTEKLISLILQGMAQLCTAMKIKLDSNNTTFIMPPGSLTSDQKKELSKINYNWLNSGIIKSSLSIVVEALKTRILQELMVLIFGKPKKANTGENELVNSDERMSDLIDEATCGGDQIFSLSSPANINYGEVEYNKLKKLEQIQNGNLSFQITCQGVNISIPDDPMYLFKTAPPGLPGGETVTPQEAMSNVFSFTQNQIQKKTSGDSSLSNAKTGSKSFIQKFLETLISSITCLLKPFFVGVIGTVPGEANGVAGDAYVMLMNGLMGYLVGMPNSPVPPTFKTDCYPASSCEITKGGYDKNNLTEVQKKKVSLMIILCNLILNMAIGFILAYVIEKVKKLIKKYIAKRAQEKMKRKTEKMKANYDIKYGGAQRKKAQKSATQVALLKVVQPALQPSENTIELPFNV